MIITRATVILALGVIQILLAFSAMALAGVLYFNVFDVQALLNLTQGAVTFDLVILFAFGFFLIASGILLINEWREIR
jgi:hypothetical protein